MAESKFVEIEGSLERVVVQKIKGQLWIHWRGETHVLRPQQERKGQQAGARPSDRIEAPMPGKIVRVDGHIGQKIEAGKVVVVMEAMKMEYSLAASVDSSIVSLECKVGDQVKLGQILVRFKI